MKNILAKIFAAWALIVFGTTITIVALIVWITGFLPEPKKTEVFRRVSIVWIRLFLFLSGCSLKVRGTGNFIHGKNYIVCCNHNSFMDIPVVTPFIPGPNKTIAKAEMARIPVFGTVYKRGSILVDRNDKKSRENSFRKMKQVLSQGMHMCIYPEGTRNKTSLPLKSFHNGAFKLALETNTSIIPALILNTKKVLPATKGFYFWPSKIELHFLAEVNVNPQEDVEILKEKVYRIMTDYYLLNQK